MSIRGSNLLFLPVFLLIVAVTSVRTQETSAYTELDPSVAAGIELNKKARIDLYFGREKSDEIHASRVKVSAGISFRLKPRFKRFLDAVDTDKQHVMVVGILYEYSVAVEPGKRSVENRIILDDTLRWTLPSNFLLSDRNRFEFRWVNGDYHLRYRNRPMVERPFKIGKREIMPYLAAEVFWDQRYRDWNIYKFTGGILVPVARHYSLDFFYERQRCINCADKDANIYGGTLYIFLKPKKKKINDQE
jgi:Protein of unknown function (DUF2490)